MLRWHRDLLRRRHAQESRPKRPGRARTVRSIRALVLRLVDENPGWGYRRVHSQAQAIVAIDFFETRTLTGARLTVLAAIEHATRRIRIHGATARPTAQWVTQVGRNLAMDLQDSGVRVKYLIRDRDARYPAALDALLAHEGIETVKTGVRMPRMNSLMERWIRSCRAELLDRTLIWNQAHLLHALREYQQFFNNHRPHRALHSAAPLPPLPQPMTGAVQLDQLNVRRRDRLGGTLHEYQHAA